MSFGLTHLNTVERRKIRSGSSAANAEDPGQSARTIASRAQDVHDFHLSQLGGGGVEETTRVTETGETTWVVSFEPGEYRYMCDPHPSMNGRFTVR